MKNKNLTQSISLSEHISDIENTIPNEDIFLPPNKTFKLLINYPCKGKLFNINTGKNGMGSLKLIRKIGIYYKEIYKDPKGNGVWGHDIGDLFLEGIEVNFEKKLITLHVGS